jgi:hypothetical protein
MHYLACPFPYSARHLPLPLSATHVLTPCPPDPSSLTSPIFIFESRICHNFVLPASVYPAPNHIGTMGTPNFYFHSLTHRSTPSLLLPTLLGPLTLAWFSWLSLLPFLALSPDPSPTLTPLDPPTVLTACPSRTSPAPFYYPTLLTHPPLALPLSCLLPCPLFHLPPLLCSGYIASMYHMSWNYHVVMTSLVPDYSITFHTMSHSDSYYYRD